MKVLDVLSRSAQTHAPTIWRIISGDSPTLRNLSTNPWISILVKTVSPLAWLLWNNGQNLYSLGENLLSKRLLN